MSSMKTTSVLLALGLTLAGIAHAQTSTGTLSGRVTYDDEGLPGVTVRATSPVLQGQRVTVTGADGNYVLPGLPPGDFRVSLELEGFRTLDQEIKILVAQSKFVDAIMIPEATTGEIEVIDYFETVTTGTTGAGTVPQESLEQLAVDRSLESAVVLSAGTGATGPNDQISISGGQSFENLYTMNGIVLNDNIRNQAMAMYIEDAIDQTTVLTSGMSAEFGRFAGGVVTMITKSGGNDFSGSLRVNLSNDDWVSSTPVTTTKVDEINPTYELTFGGPLWKDRLWFFLAARHQQIDTSMQTYITQIPYVESVENKRIEGKLTALLAKNHRVSFVYSNQQTPVTNGAQGPVPPMDLDSIDPTADFDNTGIALNYTGVLSDNLFVEAQYSRRDFDIINSGGDDPTLSGGTLIWDYLVQGSYNAPWFCGEPCGDQQRDNENILAKASWFVSTENVGTHELVFGIDVFDDQVVFDLHQSASDFHLWTIVPTDFSTGVPQLQLTTFGGLIVYYGIPEKAQRSSFKTNSAYINDTWRLNKKLTLNLGLRWDQNDGTDAGGNQVVKDSQWSPRLGASWDIQGDGKWIVNASAGRYVSSIIYGIGNAGSSAGWPVFLAYLYTGPPAFASELGGNQAALDVVFDWFFNVYGGLENPSNIYLPPNFPGITPQIGEDLGSPYADEFTIGISTRLGSRGVLRADYVHRTYGDFYSNSNAPMEWAASPFGPVDLSITSNNNEDLERRYDGLMTRFQYRAGDRWNIGANWTWSHAKGNIENETSGGAFAGSVNEYREYKDLSWFAPVGDLQVDQRHKAAAWVIWDAISTQRNKLSISLLQRLFSGTPYSAVGVVNNSLGLAYVGNPGYITPPAIMDYYFSDRGEYTTDTITSTDIALNYSFFIPTGNSAVEIFIQPEILNVFNEQGVVNVNKTVITSESDPSLQIFNPLTETPVEGIHWYKGAAFGQPLAETDYQQPRTFRISMGVRF